MKRMILPLLILFSISFGMNIKTNAQCTVSISEPTLPIFQTLNAAAVNLLDSTAVFSYVWNTGDTTAIILSPISGTTYCVTATDNIDSCTASACYTFQDSISNHCSVTIIPTGPPDSTNYLVAQPGSVGLYSFVWNTGDSTQLINMFNVPGIYCVTMTDSSGCSASSCFVFNPLGNYCSDSVLIIETGLGLEAIILSQDSNATFTAAWNNGTSGTSIENPIPGQTYCVSFFNTIDSTCFASACYTFQDSVVKIQEFNSIQALTLYPNPVQAELFIELNVTKAADAQIILHDVLGQVLKVKNIQTQMGQNIMSLDVLNLQPGIYFVTYIQNQEVKTLRFLKQ
jgi:hypothetical protein